MSKLSEYDANDLGAAAGIPVMTAPGAGVVTGDDVTSRMTILFENKETAAGPAEGEPEVLDHVDIGGDKPLENDEEVGVATVKGLETDVVSGSDISSRIEQLFGGEEEPPPPAKPVPARGADGAMVAGEESSASPVFAAPTRELPADELRPLQSAAVSGEDITSRLNEMFDETPQGAPLSVEEPQDEVVPSAPVAASEEIVVEAQESDMQIAAPEDIMSPGTGDIFAESEEPVSLAPEVVDDAATFEPAAAQDILPAATGSAAFLSEEDTKFPLDMSEGGIVIDEGAESSSLGSETIVARPENRKAGLEPAETLQAAEPSEEPAIDSALIPEADEEEPGMSGDDVVKRMNELFHDSLIADEGLKSAESIPEGDKDDAVANLGFYTMSGENAETSPSADALLSELDKVDLSERDSDASDMARETEEKTVLVDDDGIETAVPGEEETIASGGADPFVDSLQPGGPKPDRNESSDKGGQPDHQAQEPFFAVEEPGAEPDAAQRQTYSIPDHVLTPTLADIYYQQGQPRLALEIYRRLLEAIPTTSAWRGE